MKLSKGINIAFVICISIFLFNDYSYSQNFKIEGFGGHSYFLEKNAGGYDIGLGVSYPIAKKSMLGLSLSHTFNDVSPLPSDLTAAKIILKEESNRLPLGFGWPDWEEDYNWPKIRLEEQPNRYFRLNMGLHYIMNTMIKNHHHFTFAMGGLISYRDESEMIKLVETEKIRGYLFVRPTDDHSIPIFNYNTYLDVGLKGDATYFFKKLKVLDLGLRTSFVYYPKSNNLMLNNGIVITLNP